MSHVIIAHGDPIVRELLEAFLSREGYAVFATVSGKEAFVEAIHEKPDLVVTDLTLLHRSGLQLIEALRRHYTASELPILVLTEHGHLLRPAVRAGASGYLTASQTSDWDMVVNRITQLLAA